MKKRLALSAGAGRRRDGRVLDLKVTTDSDAKLDTWRARQRHFSRLRGKGFDERAIDTGSREQLRRSSVKRIYADVLQLGWWDSTLQSSARFLMLPSSARGRLFSYVIARMSCSARRIDTP